MTKAYRIHLRILGCKMSRRWRDAFPLDFGLILDEHILIHRILVCRRRLGRQWPEHGEIEAVGHVAGVVGESQQALDRCVVVVVVAVVLLVKRRR